MHDFSRLDDAIATTLRAGVAELREADASLVMLACGMVEDLTGFFISGAGSHWIAALPGTTAERSEYAWSPSEWPLSANDESDAAPGRVTAAIWELSGTQAEIDGTGEELAEEAYDALRVEYEDRIMRALEALRQAGELRNAAGRELMVWLHSADAADEDLDDRSFARLQSPELVALFEQRYASSEAADALFARVTAG